MGIRGGKEIRGARVKGGRKIDGMRRREMEGEVRKLKGGGKEKVLFIYFCTGCGGSLYMPKH